MREERFHSFSLVFSNTGFSTLIMDEVKKKVELTEKWVLCKRIRNTEIQHNKALSNLTLTWIVTEHPAEQGCWDGVSSRAPWHQPVFWTATNSSCTQNSAQMLPLQRATASFFYFFPCLFNSLGFDQCCFLLTASSKRSLGIQGHFPQRQTGCPKQLHKLAWIWISRKFCSLCWNWSICRCTAYQYSHLIVQC